MPAKKECTKPRAKAFLARPAEGQSYAVIFCKLHRKVKPNRYTIQVYSSDMIRGILELGAQITCKEASHKAIKGILEKRVDVSPLKPRYSLTIRDLDCLTSKEKVGELLKHDLQDLGEVQIGLTAERSRKQLIAILNLGKKKQQESH